ncbi:unnamed protein product [Oikopleura dioica]|uniref:Uncharacterized protein n=2 Tax=Oikopleura dioica TaxID=34765 RepID=E4X5U4_OIKDI|nr:unnamed protein product [Oikopleura dioica]
MSPENDIEITNSVEIGEEEQDGDEKEDAENQADDEEEFAMIMEEEIQNVKREIVYVYVEGIENQNLRANETDYSFCETSESEVLSGWSESDVETFSVISSHHD